MSMSISVNFHNPVVQEVSRHPSGIFAVTIGEYPTSLVLFFHEDHQWDAFVDSVNGFLTNEALDREEAPST